jgi:hypothetical protein
MTDNKNEKVPPSLRTFDKREAQRKSLREKEMEDAIQHQELIKPKIYYEGDEVNDIQIWLDMLLDTNSTIYIGPFISKDRKDSSIRLRYTIDSTKHANISNDPKNEIISDWMVHSYEKIIVKHNKLNTGVMIQKMFGLKDLGVKDSDDRIEKSLYIPMTRILHIVTNDNRYNDDIIEK